MRHERTLTQDRIQLGPESPAVYKEAGGIALLGIIIAVVALFFRSQGREQFFHSYLVSYVYFLSISLGALFFVMLQHLTRAGWSVVVRRVAEAMSVNLLLMAVLVIPLIIGLEDLYHWTHTEAVASDPILRGKASYLNVPFFLARLAVYFLVWVGLALFFWRKSLAQDRSGDPGLTLSMEKLSAPAMIVFALTVTFAAFDLLMSLDPHWFSTIYGIYYFSGAIVGFLASLILVLYYLQRAGLLQNAVTLEHYHDLGKLLFGFIVFWAYIAFSQYMLIWYANIPEETVWYARRQTGDWTAISLLLLFGHFVVPFLALISRVPKRNKTALAVGAGWMLVMHYIDLYWLAMPEAHPGRLPDHWWLDLATLLAIGGLYVAGIFVWLGRRPLAPVKDPRLPDSLAFENF